MHGMEYSQIIHPSGRIKWLIGRIKKQLGMKLVFSPPNTKLKNHLCQYGPSVGIKSDRLLGVKYCVSLILLIFLVRHGFLLFYKQISYVGCARHQYKHVY